MRIFSSLVLLAAGGCLRSAGAQSLVSQVSLSTTGGTTPWGSGYALGYVYYCAGVGSGAVWKVATGNANGPSTTAPSEVNAVSVSANCYDGTVNTLDGVGYWALYTSPIKVAKTQGNAGNTPMTLVGEYSIPSSSGYGASIALDEVNNMVYVGSTTNAIYKLDAGAPSALPSLLQSLTLPGSDGTLIYGMAVDPTTGYGYAGTASGSYSVIKFFMGAGTGPMTRIGAVAAASDIYGFGLNIATGALYSGYSSAPPDAEMYLTGTGAALPSLVGTFEFSQASTGSGLYTNKAFVVSRQCNYLFAAADSYPAEVNFFDLTTGTVVPTLKGSLALPTNRGMAGAVDEYGYSYYTTSSTPVTVYKISAPQCSSPSPEAGPITLTGNKLPRMHARPPNPAISGKTLKVQFQLTRWNANIPVRRQLNLAHLNKTAGGFHSKVWENYTMAITIPAPPAATLVGKPRVSPAIPKSKGPSVFNNTLLTWASVPMLVSQKNYTRKFTIAMKVAKTFVGNLTFSAVATGPNDAKRNFALTVPVVAHK